MATKAGVWIDHKQAIVVLLTDAGKEIKKASFDIGQPIRSKAGSRSTRRYKPGEYVAEDRLERKLENDRRDYYDEVIASFSGAKALLILGPGEAKGEFLKRLKSKKVRGVTVELETVDKMTDRQIAAKVGRHFAPAERHHIGYSEEDCKEESFPRYVRKTREEVEKVVASLLRASNRVGEFKLQMRHTKHRGFQPIF